MSGLTEAGQTALDDCERDRACDKAVDRVRARYGSQALRRAGGGLALDQGEDLPAQEMSETEGPADGSRM